MTTIHGKLLSRQQVYTLSLLPLLKVIKVAIHVYQKCKQFHPQVQCCFTLCFAYIIAPLRQSEEQAGQRCLSCLAFLTVFPVDVLVPFVHDLAPHFSQPQLTPHASCAISSARNVFNFPRYHWERSLACYGNNLRLLTFPSDSCSHPIYKGSYTLWSQPPSFAKKIAHFHNLLCRFHRHFPKAPQVSIVSYHSSQLFASASFMKSAGRHHVWPNLHRLCSWRWPGILLHKRMEVVSHLCYLLKDEAIDVDPSGASICFLIYYYYLSEGQHLLVCC